MKTSFWGIRKSLRIVSGLEDRRIVLGFQAGVVILTSIGEVFILEETQHQLQLKEGV